MRHEPGKAAGPPAESGFEVVLGPGSGLPADPVVVVVGAKPLPPPLMVTG